jgi:hypothetical protein
MVVTLVLAEQEYQQSLRLAGVVEVAQQALELLVALVVLVVVAPVVAA